MENICFDDMTDDYKIEFLKLANERKAKKIAELEREIKTMKQDGTCKVVSYEKAPWWANPDSPTPKITC